MITGFLIGLATLTKIYPILLLVVILPGGDEKGTPIMHRIQYHYIPLLASCFATIITGYLPYLILGHGQAFGFFAAYASEQGQNAGATQQIVHWLGDQLHLSLTKAVTLEHIVDVVLISTSSLMVFVLRWRNRLSIEAGTLLLFGVILSISSHIFPWYATTLLLWIPLLVGPFWTRTGLAGRGLAVIAVWYFTTAVLLSYFFNSAPGISPDWTAYYKLVYMPVMVVLGVSAIIGVMNRFRFQKRL